MFASDMARLRVGPKVLLPYGIFRQYKVSYGAWHMAKILSSYVM
jgi:hypothetical protein